MIYNPLIMSSNSYQTLIAKSMFIMMELVVKIKKYDYNRGLI